VPALSFVSTFGGACAFAVLTLCIGVHQQLDTVLIAAKHTHSVFFKNIAQFFIRIPMLVPFAVFGGAGIFAANCLSAVLPLIALAWGYRYDLVKTPLRFSTEELRAHAGFSGANFLGGVASSVPGLLFPILLSAWASPQEAGFFYIPWMMFSVLMSAVGAVTGMYAVESNHAGNLRPYFRKACVLGFGGAILAMCVFGLFGGEILGMFKKDFSVHSLVILRWLCAALLPCAGLGLYGSVLLFHKRSRTIAVFNVVQLLVLAVVALLFVPSRGAVGVAQAWFLTSVIMMLFVAIKTFWNAICLKKTYADSFLS
jgi:O-antigen/teichoic acid export membrane protein